MTFRYNITGGQVTALAAKVQVAEQAAMADDDWVAEAAEEFHTENNA